MQIRFTVLTSKGFVDLLQAFDTNTLQNLLDGHQRAGASLIWLPPTLNYNIDVQ